MTATLLDRVGDGADLEACDPYGEKGYVVVSRHRDCLSVLRDAGQWLSDARKAPVLSGGSNDQALFFNPPVTSDELRPFLFQDAPNHERLRRLVARAFTPRTVAELRPRVEHVARSLLDDMRASGEVDFVEAFAFPLPVVVICELLGVPAEDRDRFKHWSAALAGAMDPPSGRSVEDGIAAFGMLCAYLAGLVEDRQASPRADLVSALVSRSSDGQLTPAEVVGTALLILVAGHETTTGLLAGGVLALLDHPEQLRAVRDGVGERTVADELVRYVSPLQVLARIAASDTELGGIPVRRGQQVLAVVAAGNRDPELFVEPHRLDVTRQNASQHLGFGFGVHVCLGAALARLEAHVAIPALVRAFPRLRLTGPPVRRPGIAVRSMSRMPVRVA